MLPAPCSVMRGSQHRESPPALGVRVRRPPGLARLPRAASCSKFLESIEVDYLFLVGDIVDFWSLRRSFYWPRRAQRGAARRSSPWRKEGTQVIYVPGNHDENIREFCGSMFGNVSIRRRYVHATADGREFLVHAWRRVRLGGEVQPLARALRRHRVRLHDAHQSWRERCAAALFGLPHWSLASYLKLTSARTPCVTSKRSSTPPRRPRSAAISRASSAATFTVRACGEIDGVLYCNDGDWVESCTALGRST